MKSKKIKLIIVRGTSLLLFVFCFMVLQNVVAKAKERTNGFTVSSDGPVEIHLNSREGIPLSDANITVNGSETTTDENGIAQYEYLESGTYEISIEPVTLDDGTEIYYTTEPVTSIAFTDTIILSKSRAILEADGTSQVALYTQDWGACVSDWALYYYDEDYPCIATSGGSVEIGYTSYVDIVSINASGLPSAWDVYSIGGSIYCNISSNSAYGYYTYTLTVSADEKYTGESAGTYDIDCALYYGGETKTMTVYVCDYDLVELEGAVVYGNLGATHDVYASGVTDSDGRVIFDDWEIRDNEPRTITLECNGYISETHLFVPEYYAPEMEYWEDLLVQPAMGALTINVNDTIGELKECNIKISTSEQSFFSKTNENGIMAPISLNYGTYMVEIQKDGYQTISKEVVLDAEHEEITLTETMIPLYPRTIDITLIMDEVLLDDAYMEIRGERFCSDAEGKIQIENVLGTKYSVMFGKRECLSQNRMIDLTAGDYEATIHMDWETDLRFYTIEDFVKRIDGGDDYLALVNQLDKASIIGEGFAADETTMYEWRPLMSNAKQVSAGRNHCLVLKNDGTVWAMGRNTYGQLGTGDTTDRNTFTEVSNLTDVVQVTTGLNSSYALKSDGTVWAWGHNQYGQLGNGSNIDSGIPVQVSNLTGINQIDAGNNHAVAITSSSAAYTWGSNLYGQLGNGTNTDRNIPVKVFAAIDYPLYIAAGGDCTFIIKELGTVWGCGYNLNGELGIGTYENVNYLAQNPYITNAIRISSGSSHALIQCYDGTVYATGNNLYHAVSQNDITKACKPQKVLGIRNAKYIHAGNGYNAVVTKDNELYTWGRNTEGQLGTGDTVDRKAPELIEGVHLSRGNTTLEDAIDISTLANANQTMEDAISVAGQHRFYKIIPSYSASYTFESVGSNDTYGYLKNSSGTQLASNDDSGAGLNFKITYSLTANTEYILEVKAWSSSRTFEYTLHAKHNKTITKNDVVQETNPKLYTALIDTDKELDADKDGTITIAELEGLTGALILSKHQIENINGLQACTGISSLYLDHNSITDLTPISCLNQLTYLNVDANQLTNLDALSGLTELRTLSAKENQITQVSGIKQMDKLTNLYLDYNQIVSVAPMTNLDKLTHLSISHNSITSIAGIAKVLSLRYLNLSDNQIRNVYSLQELYQMKDLRLSNNSITSLSSSGISLQLTDYRRIAVDGNAFNATDEMDEIDKINAKNKVYQLR
ncbi:MAG: leucine-rich repeat domain-containing protein [Lachnospiraceae bacterium]